MNTYHHRFVCACPNNGLQIVYDLEIESQTMIHVEHIVTAAALHKTGYHEDLADHLHKALGGLHTLRAHHHGVDIETRRGAPEDMAGFKHAGCISEVHARMLGAGLAVLTHITPKSEGNDVQLFVREAL